MRGSFWGRDPGAKAIEAFHRRRAHSSYAKESEERNQDLGMGISPEEPPSKGSRPESFRGPSHQAAQKLIKYRRSGALRYELDETVSEEKM